jgi:hypothetical protein
MRRPSSGLKRRRVPCGPAVLRSGTGTHLPHVVLLSGTNRQTLRQTFFVGFGARSKTGWLKVSGLSSPCLAGPVERWRERSPQTKSGWYITRERARAYLALVQRDTADALRRLLRVTDSLCLGCFEDRLLIAQLLGTIHRDRDAEARLAGTILLYAPSLELPWVLERARVSERLGHHDEAIADYRFVADMWRHADPELQHYVEESRTALSRLGGRQQ